jgi:hypothetical protein
MAGLAHLSLVLTVLIFRAALRLVPFLFNAFGAARAGWRVGWHAGRQRLEVQRDHVQPRP